MYVLDVSGSFNFVSDLRNSKYDYKARQMYPINFN